MFFGCPRGVLGVLVRLRESWNALGGSWSGLGASWGGLGQSWELDFPKKVKFHAGQGKPTKITHFGGPGLLLGPLLGALGAVLGPLGALLGRLGAILGHSWGGLGASWAPLGAS